MAEKLARDQAGNIWVVDDAGKPVRLHQPSGAPNVVVRAPADQKLPGELTNQTLTNEGIGLTNKGKAIDLKIKELEAQLKNAEIILRDKELQQNKAITPVQRADAISGFRNAQMLGTQIDDIIARFGEGPGATSGLEGVQDFFPSQANSRFDEAGNAPRGSVGQALGFTGSQLNTPRETEAAVGPFLPQASNYDSSISDKIARLRELQKLAEDRAVAILGGVPDAQGNILPIPQGWDKRFDAPAAPPPTPPANDRPDPLGFSGDGTRDEIDPVLKGVAGRLGKMVSAGASDATILEFLQKNGVNPANTNIQSVLRHRKTDEYKAWQRANPGKAYPIGAEFYTNKVPLTPGQKIGNAAAQSAPGAAVINFAQGATGNRLDEMATFLGGDADAVNTGVQLSRANSPYASFFGDMGGQAFAQYALNRIPGAGRLQNSWLGRFGEDLGYGIFAGHGEGDTLGGAVSNVLGGQAGRGVGRGISLGVRGANSSTALRYLNDQNILLTPGQIARGTDSTLGDIVANTEDRMGGMPVVDAIVNNARTRGVEGVNQAAFRQAHNIGTMPYPGRTGSLGLEDLGRAETQAYSFLDPLRMPVDPTLTGDLAGVRASIPGLPAHGAGVTANLDAIDKLSHGGALTGRDWQDAIRGVRMDRQSLAGKEFPRQATDAFNNIETSMNNFVGRAGPADAASNLSAANTLYRHGKVLDSAVSASPSQRREQLFSPLTLNQQSIASQKRLGLDPNATNRPFYDLTTNALEVMPNEVPDSGTAGRGLLAMGALSLAGGATGGAMGAGYGGLSESETAGGGALTGGTMGALAIPLLLSAPYSKTGQKAIQKTLLGPRPKWMKDLDDSIAANPYLRKLINKRAAGMLGSAVGRDIAIYPELEEGF